LFYPLIAQLTFNMEGDETDDSSLHHKFIQVNDEDIAPLVDALLADPNVNSWLIPDFLERPMYDVLVAWIECFLGAAVSIEQLIPSLSCYPPSLAGTCRCFACSLPSVWMCLAQCR
jgi:hypothetical protein